MLVLFLTLSLLPLSSGTSIQLLKTHGTLRPEPCAHICMGTTGRRDTLWEGGPGLVYTVVDIQGCNFVDPPVVTISVEAGGVASYLGGTSTVSGVRETGFMVVLVGYTVSSYWVPKIMPGPETANGNGWNVNWFAAGYVC